MNLVSQEYAIVHVPLSGVLPLSFAHHTYSAIPKLYGLQDTTAPEASGILPVFSQPNLMSTGQGILIGMIDTGIDYTNPLFQNPDGTSRILRLWDQTIESENTPEAVAGFQPFYGHRLQPGRLKPRPGLRTAAGAWCPPLIPAGTEPFWPELPQAVRFRVPPRFPVPPRTPHWQWYG